MFQEGKSVWNGNWDLRVLCLLSPYYLLFPSNSLGLSAQHGGATPITQYLRRSPPKSGTQGHFLPLPLEQVTQSLLPQFSSLQNGVGGALLTYHYKG